MSQTLAHNFIKKKTLFPKVRQVVYMILHHGLNVINKFNFHISMTIKLC